MTKYMTACSGCPGCLSGCLAVCPSFWLPGRLSVCDRERGWANRVASGCSESGCGLVFIFRPNKSGADRHDETGAVDGPGPCHPPACRMVSPRLARPRNTSLLFVPGSTHPTTQHCRIVAVLCTASPPGPHHALAAATPLEQRGIDTSPLSRPLADCTKSDGQCEPRGTAKGPCPIGCLFSSYWLVGCCG